MTATGTPENPPAEAAPLGRRGGHRNLRAGGPSVYDTPPIRAARWLLARQHEDGSWPAPGGGPANTALALLVLHAEGPDRLNVDSDAYRDALRAAVDHLIGLQDEGGCFGSRDHPGHLRDHAVCTLALVEIGDRRHRGELAEPVAAGIRYLRATEERWRADPAVAPWAVLALREAKALDGVDVDVEAGPPAVRAWLRIVLGEDPRKSDAVKADIARVVADIEGRGRTNPGVLTFCLEDMACFQFGGDAYETSLRWFREVVVPSQREDGSFDPVGEAEQAWLGRVGVTALTALCFKARYCGARELGLR